MGSHRLRPATRENLLARMRYLIEKHPGIRPRELHRYLKLQHSAGLRNILRKRGLVRKESRGGAVHYFPIYRGGSKRRAVSPSLKVHAVRVRRQTTGACGPYALESVLRFHGGSAPVGRIARLAETTRAHGTEPEHLAAAARTLGYSAKVKRWAELRDLQRALKRNRPPIVLWFSEHEGHYSVVVGLDRRFVSLADPELGRVRKLARRSFRRCWFDFSTDGPEKNCRLYPRWMLIVAPSR